MKKTKKNAQDATLRNTRARKKEIDKVKDYVSRLEKRVKALEEKSNDKS